MSIFGFYLLLLDSEYIALSFQNGERTSYIDIL